MKQKLFLFATLVSVALTTTSCFKHQQVPQSLVVPKAINTINSVGLEELNLKHGTDYTIVNTVTADATILYSEQKKGQQITLKEENGEFRLVYRFNSESGHWFLIDFDGIARFGFLNNDYGQVSLREVYPEDVVRNLAIYRLINASKVRGADGVIEPVVSTNVEQRGREIVFKTTVSAKLVKLKTDAK
jgi:hypothetical protein